MEDLAKKPQLNYKKQNFNRFKNVIGKLSTEDKEKAHNNIKKSQYSNSVYSSLVQQVREDNKRWIESGADPAWVLKMSADQYAKIAVEKRDPNILGFIETIDTKYGNYAQTKKGQDIIYSANSKISSILNSEETANRAYTVEQEKVEKKTFRIKVNQAYTDYKVDPSDENKEVLESLKQQSDLAGFDNIFATVVRNIDTITEATTVTYISSADFPDEVESIISDEKLVTLGDNLEASVGEVEAELRRQGKTIKSEDKALLKQIVSAYTNTDIIPFYKDLLGNVTKDIGNLYENIATASSVARNQDKDLAPSVEGMKEVRSLVEDMEEGFLGIYRDNLKDAKEKKEEVSGEKIKGMLTFNHWLPESVEKFKGELETLMQTIYTDKDGVPSEAYKVIKDAYESDLPTSSPEALSKYLERLKERRGQLKSGDNMTDADSNLTAEEREAAIIAIGEELADYDTSYEQGYQRAKNLLENEYTKKKINTLQYEVDLEEKAGLSTAARSVQELLKKHAGESTAKIKQELLEFRINNRVAFSDEIDKYTDNFASAAKDYTELEIFKTAEQEYKNKVRDAFPGFKLGLLSSPSFGLSTEIKLAPIQQEARKLIIDTAQKVNEYIRDEKLTAEQEFGEPYELWDTSVKKTFDTRLHKAILGTAGFFGKEHIDKLEAMRGTASVGTSGITSSAQYSTPQKVFRSALKVTNKAEQERQIEKIKGNRSEFIKFNKNLDAKLNKLGTQSFNDLYKSIVPPSEEKEFAKDRVDNPKTFKGLSEKESLKKWKVYKIRKSFNKSIQE